MAFSAPGPTHTTPAGRSVLALALLLCGALALRLYRIDAPLWLDELFSMQLSVRGIQAIGLNSWTDAHPPGYYALQWLLSDFGQLTSAVAWRWLPALSGTLAVLAVWKASRSVASSASALASAALMATLPSLLYFSQEARPYAFVVLLASLSTWMVMAILRNGRSRLWGAWVLVSLVGLCSAYAYLMVAAIQMLVLCLRHVQRGAWWRSYLALLAGGLPLVPLAVSSLIQVDAVNRSAAPLTLLSTLQTLLAGDAGRYGASWAHAVMPWLGLGLLVLGAKRALRLRDPGLLFVFAQALVPLALFFGVASPLGMRLPLFEAKQFIGLLPAAWVLLAGGLDELAGPAPLRAARWALCGAACALALAANVTGIAAYWAIPKSPEGEVLASVRDQLQPGDALVSLHYRMDYAASYYGSQARLYAGPRPAGGDFIFQAQTLARPFDPRPATTARAGDIRAGRHFWILAHATDSRDAIGPLTAGCTVDRMVTAPPFQALLVDCG